MPTLAHADALCAKAAKGRPVPAAIQLIEKMIEAAEREKTVADRIGKNVAIIDHLRPLLSRVERTLIEDLHSLQDVAIPELRDAIGIAERLYLERAR